MEGGKAGEDWRDLLYLYSFLDMALADRTIERRERVWIRRFLANRGKPQLYERMDEVIAAGHVDVGELRPLLTRAAGELSPGEKRRFIYNLAQLLKSKGTLTNQEYEKLLDVAGKIGVPDIEADSMIHSVYSINDSFLAVIGVLAGGAILYFTRSVIIPLVIAILTTMVIYKVEGFITRAFSIRRFRWLTKLGAAIVILTVLFGLVMAAVVSGRDIVNRLPDYREKLTTVLQGSSELQAALGWLRAKGVLTPSSLPSIGSMGSGVFGGMVALLGNAVLITICTGFMVFSSSRFTGLAQEMNEKIGGYILIKSLMCLLTGTIVFVECRIFGIDFALFWGLSAFLLNYIPHVGSLMATVPLILMGMVQLDSWGATAFFALNLFALQQLIAQVLEPKLMGARLSLKPVAILLGLIFWGLIWGIPGIFLSTPLMVGLRMALSHYNVSRGLERLLASETT